MPVDGQGLLLWNALRARRVPLDPAVRIALAGRALRASGMVMLHGHHASARTVGGQIKNAWVSFGKQRWVLASAEGSPVNIRKYNLFKYIQNHEKTDCISS